jgi:hypothetical protein
MVEILHEAQAAIEAATPIVGEGIGMVELFRQLLAELPPGLELVASEVRARAQMTIRSRQVQRPTCGVRLGLRRRLLLRHCRPGGGRLRCR